MSNLLRQIIGGRDKLDAKSQKKLDKHGDKVIKEVWITRKPITSQITSLLNVVTSGKFKKEMMANGHDDLFHLQAQVVLEGGIRMALEKNDTVKISRVPAPGPDIEKRQIKVRKPITLNEAYENTIKKYGRDPKEVFGYDSLTNNCQRFVSNFLKGNASAFRSTTQDKAFVTQDLKFLLEHFPFIPSVSKIATDIGNRIGVILTGGKKMSRSNIKQMPKNNQEGGAIVSTPLGDFDEPKKPVKKDNSKEIAKIQAEIDAKEKANNKAREADKKAREADKKADEKFKKETVKVKKEDLSKVVSGSDIGDMIDAVGSTINLVVDGVKWGAKKLSGWWKSFKKGGGKCGCQNGEGLTDVLLNLKDKIKKGIKEFKAKRQKGGKPCRERAATKQASCYAAKSDLEAKAKAKDCSRKPAKGQAACERNKQDLKDQARQLGGAVALPQASGRAGNPIAAQFTELPFPVRRDFQLQSGGQFGENIRKVRGIKRRGRRIGNN